MGTKDKEIDEAIDDILEIFNNSHLISRKNVSEKMDDLLEYEVPIDEAKKSVIRYYEDESNLSRKTKNTTRNSENMKSIPKYKDYKNKTVSTSNNKKLTVGSDIGDGAEGMVYQVKNESNLAVKIFKKRRLKDGQLEKKLKVMIESQPAGADPNSNKELLFAWPSDAVYYKNQFIGYIMPLVDTENRTNIRKYLSDQLSESTSVTKKLKIAFNFASAVNLVHQFDFAIGDFNYENIFVSKSEDKVTLIDCDSYSVTDSHGNEYHGETMYEETIPPEERATTSIEAAQMADSFNLAVWLFRILNPTQTAYANPFQAKGSLAEVGKLLEMMAENPFPFWDPKSGLIEPVTGESTYTKLPIGIRVLFESAFLGGKYHPYKRPSPGVWRDVLYNCLKGNTDLSKGSLYRPNSKDLAASTTASGPDVDFSGMQHSEFGQIETRDGEDVIIGTVKSVSQLTEFDRDVDKEEDDREETGFVSNVIVENPNNRRRLTFWDKQAVSAARSLQPGLVIKASGYFRSEDFTDEFEKELYVNDYAVSHKHDTHSSIEELSVGENSVHVRGKILARSPIASTSSGNVMNLVIADDSGHISVTLWEEMAERFELIPSGLTIEIMDGYVTERNGKREISIGEDSIPPAVSDIDVAYSVDCTPLEYLEENEVVDVSGEIIDIYDYDNNGKGLRIEDNSGTTIVSINQKSLATREYNEGDQILATNTESYESNGYINVRTQYKSLVSVY